VDTHIKIVVAIHLHVKTIIVTFEIFKNL